MDQQIVTDAVRTLRTRGERVSVRAVHSFTGGSFRDLSRLLRNTGEFLADEEVADIEAEATEPTPPPSLGRIVEAFQAAQAAEQAAGEASAVRNDTRDRLRALVAQRPMPATDPNLVADSVAARLEHDALVAQVSEEARQLEKIVESHMTTTRALRAEWRKLQGRAQELREHVLPSARRDAAAARQRLSVLERDLANQLEMARRHVQRTERAIVVADAELQALTGA
jgi:hypothetical protein